MVFLLVIFTIVVILVVTFLSIYSKEILFVPSATANLYIPVEKSEIVLLQFIVYLPLINDINTVENELISKKEVLTVPQLRQKFVDENIRSSCLQWLNDNGIVLWESSSGTVVNWQCSSAFVDSLPQLYETDIFIGTLNDQIYLPFGMVALGLNLVDSNPERKNIKEWTSQLSLTNTSIQSSGFDYDLIQSNPVPTSSYIGLFEINVIGTGTLETFCQFYNNKYQTTYPLNYFNDRVIYINFDPQFNYQTIPLTNNSFDYDYYHHGEALLDILICLENNPNAIVLCFSLPANPNPLAVIYASINIFPSLRVFSSSIMHPAKISVEDYSRIRLESRLMGMLGITLFQCSGDQSSWMLFNGDTENQKFSLPNSDINLGFLLGDGVIKLGGYEKLGDKNVSMNLLNATPNNILSKIFGSTGGYFRGYPVTDFKNNYKNSYSYPYSICDMMDVNGKLFRIKGCQVDTNGDISPDLVYLSAIHLLDDEKYPDFGTSMAAPYMAILYFNILQQRVNSGKSLIPCFYKMIYSPNLEPALSRLITGRLSLYNIPGFSNDQNSMWNPLNGRGIPDIEKLTEMLLKY